MARLKRLVCALALAASGCGSQGATNQSAASAPIAAPSQMRPDTMAAYVTALLKANRIDDAKLWYVRGIIRSAVWNSLKPDSSAVEGYLRLVGAAPGPDRLADIEPDAVRKLAEDAVAWEASTPLDISPAPTAEQLASLPGVRKQTADELASEIARMADHKNAGKQMDAEIARSGVTAEAKSIIPASMADRVIPLSSAHLGCKGNFYFEGSHEASAPGPADGRIVAIDTCDGPMIVDALTGKVLQRASPADSGRTFVTTDGGSLRLIGLTDRGFREMTATSPLKPLAIPLPEEIAGRKFRVQVADAGSSDGRLAAAQFCADNLHGCNLYVVFDLVSRKIVWKALQRPGRYRLMHHIDRIDGQYVLASELRAADGMSLPYTGEQINLSTGAVTDVSYDDLPQEYAPEAGHAGCGLRERSHNDFRWTVTWPDGKQGFDLIAPARERISDCAVSANGSVLLVAAPPYIHRFRLQP